MLTRVSSSLMPNHWSKWIETYFDHYSIMIIITLKADFIYKRHTVLPKYNTWTILSFLLFNENRSIAMTRALFVVVLSVIETWHPLTLIYGWSFKWTKTLYGKKRLITFLIEKSVWQQEQMFRSMNWKVHHRYTRIYQLNEHTIILQTCIARSQEIRNDIVFPDMVLWWK